MILTGKSKEDFNKWLNSDEDILQGLDLFQLNNTCIYALIIEWFRESVKLHIVINVGIPSDNVNKKNRIHYYFNLIKIGKHHKSIFKSVFFKSFEEATQKAIEKANEIYNNQNK